MSLLSRLLLINFALAKLSLNNLVFLATEQLVLVLVKINNSRFKSVQLHVKSVQFYLLMTFTACERIYNPLLGSRKGRNVNSEA